eukprot:scaffold79272_cov22-Tisochrysis_lutea.AAC.1
MRQQEYLINSDHCQKRENTILAACGTPPLHFAYLLNVKSSAMKGHPDIPLMDPCPFHHQLCKGGQGGE